MTTSPLRCLLIVLFVSLTSVANAEEALPSAESEKRIAIISMFPDSVLYIDQGFGSFTRNKLEVPKHTPSFDVLLKSAVEQRLSERGVAHATFVVLPNTVRDEIVKAIESEGVFQSREETLRPFFVTLKD